MDRLNDNIATHVMAAQHHDPREIPEPTLDALTRYLEDGIEPGSFLKSLLCNDLKEAFARAGALNIFNMFGIVKHLYNNVPATAWGSEANYNHWLNMKAAEWVVQRAAKEQSE